MAAPPRVVAHPEAGRGGSSLPGTSGSRVGAFLRGAAPLFVALSLLNVSNYVFHVVASRMLGPSAYGALAALLALILVASVPCGVLQTVVAKRVAVLRSRGAEDDLAAFGASAVRGVGIYAAGGAVVLLLVSPVVAAFVHVSLGAAALLAPLIFLAVVTSVPLGVLQGRLRFAGLGVAMVAGVLVRLAAGLGLIEAGLGVEGAILGSVIAQGVALAVALRLLHLPTGALRGARAATDWLRGEFAVTLAALASFWVLAEGDLVLARHFLERGVSGIYSGAGVIARTLLFLPGAVALVALPRFAEARDREDEARRWLGVSLGVTAALGALAFGALWVLREPIMRVTYGERYAAESGFLPQLAAAMAFLALVNVLVYFHVALDSKAHRLILAGVGLEIVLITLFHETPEQIAIVVAGVSALVAAAEYQAARAVLRYRPVGVGSTVVVEEGEPVIDGTPELSVVLPCHNSAVNLPEVLERLLKVGDGMSREIVVVSDGSTDDTVQIARTFPSDLVRVLSYADHEGKGQALRVGLAAARGTYVAFLDSDGDIDPASLEPFLSIARLYDPDIVLGSKRHPLSQVHYPPLRRALSWTYHKLTRLLFRVNVRDTQTGLKLIRRDVLEAVLPRMLEKRYAFDLELLVVARKMGYTAVFEAPVRIDYRFESHVDVGAVYRILLDTMAIFYRRYVLDTYRSADRGPSVADRADGKLRILFLNWRDIRNPDAGGAEVVTHEVSKRWVAAGHEVTLFTSRFRGCSTTEVVDGVRIRRMGRLRAGTCHLRVQWELARLEGYDVVIDEINTVPFFTPLWRRRLPPIVGFIHQLAVEVWDAEVPRPIAAIGRRLEPRMLRLYRDVPMVTVSESTKRDLVALGIRDVTVIPQGRDEPPDVADVPKEPVPTFLFVGRLTPNKRPDHAVEAFRLIREQLSDARLWIVGRGPMEGALRETLPAGAEMLGYLPREELYRRMAAAHCLLVTSVREGWGMVITEAAGVGTPAVGYDVPGVRDAIVDGETGLLSSASERELARHAVSLVHDQHELECTSDRAWRWAGTLEWRRTAAALFGLVEDLPTASLTSLGHAGESTRGWNG